MSYKTKIKGEAKAFDRQVRKREVMGLVPDLRRLKKNNKFYNNPWRDPKIFELQWGSIIKKIIKDISKQKKKLNVLEVGCGTGFLSLEIARHGHNVHGIDVSPFSIFHAENYKNRSFNRKIRNNLTYLVGDANNFKFELNYDIILFYRSLHHFKNISKLLKNLKKFQKKKSIIIVCEPMRKNFDKENAVFANILRLILPTWESYKKKLKGKLDFKFIKRSEEEIFKEYKYLKSGKKKAQSPLDNSTDNPNLLIKKISNFYKINNLAYHDAFIDKLIGGIRGKEQYKLANLLKNFDNYLITNKILKGTTLYLTGKLK